MLTSLKKTANITYTENGAVTYESTESYCLDLFSRIGAMRNADDKEIIRTFTKAYVEDPDLAMRILFFTRDVRGGLGERRVFRVIMKWLAGFNRDSAAKNIANISEYGRYDDILELLDTDCKDDVTEIIRAQLTKDMEALESEGRVSLLAKWLPSVNASSRETVRRAKAIARGLDMDDASYRKTLSRLRAAIKIIENNLREKDYSFDYSKQPSKAMFKYRAAFFRNDHDRYMEFLEGVRKGEVEMNTGTLMPYDIIAPVIGWEYCGCRNGKVSLDADTRKAMDVTWNALEDFTDGRNALAVIDGSGSMYGYGTPMPAAVAISLGLYFAERNTGRFKDHFITFSRKPKLVEVKGRDIAEKVIYCEGFNEIANTDIEKVFRLILDAAVRDNLPQSELPETLYIISDMEFDWCTDNAGSTNFENAKRMFASHGYRLPQVVFWNVQSRNSQVPVTRNEQGVILVSGFTPRLFEMVTSGNCDPYSFMMEILSSDRYKNIAA